MHTVTEPALRKARVADARAIALVHIASSDDVYASLAASGEAMMRATAGRDGQGVLAKRIAFVVVAELMWRSSA